jgi:hypothetical protein
MVLPTENLNQQNPLPVNNAWPSAGFWAHILHITQIIQTFPSASPATHFLKQNFYNKNQTKFFLFNEV